MLIDFRELFPRWNIKPKGVIHVGGNIGEEASVYLELGIKRQFWFEPNPEIYQKLAKNISGNKYASAACYAIGDMTGKTILHIANNAGQSSSILELGTHKEVHPDVHYVNDVEVNIDTMEHFFDTVSQVVYEKKAEELQIIADNLDYKNYDFLNLDVQGFEGHVLRGMGKVLDNIKWIYTEVNSKEVYKGCMQLPEMERYLDERRFRRVETFNAGGFFDRLGWSDALFIR